MNLDQIFKSTAKIKVKNSGLKWAPLPINLHFPPQVWNWYEIFCTFVAYFDIFFWQIFLLFFFGQIHKETDQDDHQTETE